MKKKGNTERRTLRLPPALDKRVKKLSNRLGESENDIIVEALDHGIYEMEVREGLIRKP